MCHNAKWLVIDVGADNIWSSGVMKDTYIYIHPKCANQISLRYILEVVWSALYLKKTNVGNGLKTVLYILVHSFLWDHEIIFLLNALCSYSIWIAPKAK